MSVGICALCAKQRPLRESHLLPRAAYRLARDTTGSVLPSPDPLQISVEGAVQTSSQVTCELLCGGCEQLFNRNGEQEVMRECCRSSTSFRLRDKLKSDAAIVQTSTWACFAGSNLQRVRLESYRYFAMSVLWRASVGRWPGDYGRKSRRHCLGSTYEQAARQYLLGTAAFPSNMRLFIFVAIDADPIRLFSFPLSHNLGGSHVHWFQLFGLEFRMFVGKVMDPEVEALSTQLPSNEDTVFVLGAQADNPSLRKVGEIVRNSPSKGRLRKIKPTWPS